MLGEKRFTCKFCIQKKKLICYQIFLQSEIFRALEKARLLVGGRKESCYSRCGRTDRGVSSVGQVRHLKSLENNIVQLE